MIVADTGAVLALLDAGERHHRVLRRLFEAAPDDWLLPWAILPEVDYLAAAHIGNDVALAFLADIAEGAFAVEWGSEADLVRAEELARRHKTLKIGLVDAVVMAVAERLEAETIATLDIRHFAAVRLKGAPRLIPRDL